MKYITFYNFRVHLATGCLSLNKLTVQTASDGGIFGMYTVVHAQTIVSTLDQGGLSPCAGNIIQDDWSSPLSKPCKTKGLRTFRLV